MSSAPRRRSATSVSLSISGARRLALLRVAIYSIFPGLVREGVRVRHAGYVSGLL